MPDGNPQLMAVVQDALEGLSQRHTLMVIPQPAELRQYFRDSASAARSPAAIGLNLADPAIESLVAWIRVQQNPIGEIPIIAIGDGSRQLQSSHIDAAVISPTVALLVDALERVMKKRID